MKKLFKSIAVVTLAVALLLTSYSVPTMAAEQPSEVAEVRSLAEVEPVDFLTNSIPLTVGTYVGSVYFNEPVSYVTWKVGGSGGNVIFRMTNVEIGDSRQFTTTADGRDGKTEYHTKLPVGHWDIKVIFASGSNHNSFTFYFYR